MTTTFPYSTQATGWSSWAESLLTEATQLTPATLLAGQSGGVLDDHISEIASIRSAAERISDSAYTTSKTAATQDQYDRTLAAAPSEGEVTEAERAAAEVNMRRRYGSSERAGDQAIINRAANLREDRDAALAQHAQDTATTSWPEVPSSGYTASPTTPGGAPTSYGPNGADPSDGEPPWGTEDDERPAGTRLSSANTPTTSGVPLMNTALQPQQPTTASPTMTPGVTPAAAWTPTGTRPKSTIGDDRDVRERPATTTPEATPGTAPSADRGSVIHGATKGDVSGVGSNMLGQTNQPGQTTTAQSGRMGGGMMGSPMMGGLGGQPGGRSSRSGDRPEVLTSDPNLLGTVDDENSFDGGLIASGDPRFDDVLYPESRAERERRENPHLVTRR